MYLIVISSQLLWVLARHGAGVLFTTLYEGTGPTRLGTAQPTDIYIQFLALVIIITIKWARHCHCLFCT